MIYFNILILTLQNYRNTTQVTSMTQNNDVQKTWWLAATQGLG